MVDAPARVVTYDPESNQEQLPVIKTKRNGARQQPSEMVPKSKTKEP